MDYYDIEPGIGIATGDPTALGSGGPGYTFPSEPIPADLDYERGAVVMLNDGKNTNGSRFAIIAGDRRGKLDKKYTVIASRRSSGTVGEWGC
jgi:peptidyl-prolyl cis-trans isomerase B (cyclophilin B)